MTVTLDDQVQAWLASIDKPGVNNFDYMLVDHMDGKGPQIGMWNEATIGKQPTPAQLDSVTPQADAIAAQRDDDAYAQTVQSWLDQTAKTFNYSGIVAACSYVASANDLWQRQAAAFTVWRDDVWAAVIASLDADTHPPTSDLPQPAIPKT